MRIIPVLDILNRHVVHGKAGARESYRPIQSQLTDSTSAIDVARAIRSVYGFTTFYVADLDAIAGSEPSLKIYSDLLEQSFELLIDAGATSSRQLSTLIHTGCSPIIGLESLSHPADLTSICESHDPSDLIFSLDLKHGTPLTTIPDWKSREPLSLAQKVIEHGIAQLIVLDLANVGVENGVGTVELCRTIHAENPDVTLIAGGGVRTTRDLCVLRDSGVSAALVATALHQNKLHDWRSV